jgi:putative hydrolase of the HAD superfamily
MIPVIKADKFVSFVKDCQAARVRCRFAEKSGGVMISPSESVSGLPMKFDVIAFDADDTLWRNEDYYVDVHQRYFRLLGVYHTTEWIEQRLYQTEVKNLAHFGYGAKSFTLSMIETAIELSEGRIGAREIQQIIEMGKEILTTPVELLDGVAETIPKLAERYDLMVITKGDLLHQETKIAQSGLGDYFRWAEVVSEKDDTTYARLAARHRIAPSNFLMVGNSLKSDVLPVLAMGGWGVHIPYSTTWVHERVAPEALDGKHYVELARIGLLPEWLNNGKR